MSQNNVLRAVQYIRWSTDKQSRGSSEQRQRDNTIEMIEREGWEVVEQVADPGVSASTGANIRVGCLAAFLTRCELEGGHGLILVVDEQDRLSRIHPADFLEWFPRMLRTGLSFAFANNDMVVDSDSYRNQSRQIRRIFDDAVEANRYTERLSKRVRAGYQALRDNGGIVHNEQTCPGWLTIVYGNGVGGRRDRIGFDWQQDRVAILTRIFVEAARGDGYRDIARRLNVERVPTWKGGRAWHHSTIRSLLRNRAVLGEYQHQSRRRGVAAIGEPVADYFRRGGCPQPISDDLFQRANDPRLQSITSQRSQGDKFRDLFSNVTTCHACGNRMTLIERRRGKGGPPEKYLVCDGYKHQGVCHQRRRIRYATAENVVLDTLLNVALDDVHFQNDADVSEVTGRLATERRAADDIGRSLDGIAKVLDRLPDDERLLRRYGDLLKDEQEAKQRVASVERELVIAKGSASPETHVRRVADVRKDLNHFDPERRLTARKLVKLAMNDLIDRFEILSGKQAVAYPFRTHRRYPEGVPANLHYVPTESQEAVVVLRGAVRYIHLDLERGRVLHDAHTVNDLNRDTDDPVILAYRSRVLNAA